MELKRGWWKQNDGGHSFLAGELNGVWYGVDSDHELNSWNADADGLSSQAYDIPGFTLTGIYCGDGPEPVEPVQQPDPRDAEIERLKAENEKLLNAINSQSSEINRLLTRCQRLDVKLATIKSEYNNLKRIIGDH